MIYIYSTLTGIIAGVIFSLLKLPMPAPTAFSGILGIVGIFIGYTVIKLLIK